MLYAARKPCTIMHPTNSLKATRYPHEAYRLVKMWAHVGRPLRSTTLYPFGKGELKSVFMYVNVCFLFLISYLMTRVCTRSGMNNLPPISTTLAQKHAFVFEMWNCWSASGNLFSDFSKALHWAWWGWINIWHGLVISSLEIGLGSSHRFPAGWN